MLVGAEVAEAAVAAFGVVEIVDPIGHRRSESASTLATVVAYPGAGSGGRVIGTGQWRRRGIRTS
jgi:hypothetical protein